MADKLYVVVRADLSPAQQAVQACHAALALAEACAGHVPGTLVLLSVPDEHTLLDLAARVEVACMLPRGYNLQLAIFREPDLGNSATAFATNEEPARRALKSLPLARFATQTHLQPTT